MSELKRFAIYFLMQPLLLVAVIGLLLAGSYLGLSFSLMHAGLAAVVVMLVTASLFRLRRTK